MAADDYADTIATLGLLTVGGAVTGNIEITLDSDWFRTFLEAGRTYRFDLEGASTGFGTLNDPFLELVDSSGRSTHAIDDDDGVGLNANLIFTPATTGFYYLEAQSADFGAGTYRLSAIDTGVIRAQVPHPALPSSVPRPLTGDVFIDAATHGYAWQVNGGRAINWALADGFFGELWPNPQTVLSIVGSIFDTISTYANINFNYVGYYENPPEAYYAGSDITISLDQLLISSTLGNSVGGIGNFPAASFTNDVLSLGIGYQGAPGDILVNGNSLALLYPFTLGSAGYSFVLHEVGHVLGLKHTHDDGGTGHPTLASLGADDLDKDWFSVMSYNDDYDYNLRYWNPATPMVSDVLALQYLYGSNNRTNAANSVHTLAQNNRYQTIWDAGGVDVVDVSISLAGWDIELPSLEISSLIATKIGAAIPLNENALNSPLTLYWLLGDLENAMGSRFADSLTGNDLNNLLTGMGGNDFIDGGGGFDTAAFRGVRSVYTMSNAATGRTISGADGVDTLSNIERLQFNDGVLAFDNTRTDMAGRGYLIYRAAFDRTPDAEGLGYWIRALESGQDYGSVVAASFIASPEFISKYGTVLSNAAFLNLIYQNVLDRLPDAAGTNYWLNEAGGGGLNGGYARSNLLASFAISDENFAAVQPLIADGIWFV